MPSLPRIALPVAALSLLASTARAQWNPGGGDHGGSDWVIEDGAVASGVHTNVGRFVIPEGVTLRVRPFDGATGGVLEVQACELELRGAIDADGAGGRGGARAAANGGRRGEGDGGGCGGGPGSCVGQGGTGGSHGGVGGTCERETQWAREVCQACESPGGPSHCHGPPGQAQGAADDGQARMGSGGGSAGNGCGCNNAGGLGGAGGGAVKLLINEEALIDGVITANGAQPPLDVSACGYHPGGGGGAGGAIVVQTESLSGGGALSASGGRGGEADGCPSSCGSWAWAGGGGGGGRIQLFAPLDEFDGAVDVAGGAGGVAPQAGSYNYAGRPGAAGTAHRTDQPAFDLIPCEGPPRLRIEHGLVFPEAAPFNLSVTGRDPDGGLVEYSWDLDGDGQFDDAQGPEIRHTFPDDGDYPVAVEGRDDEGEVGRLEVTVRIVNRPPEIRSVPPREALENEVWEYRVDAVDPAGARDPLTYTLVQAPVGMDVGDGVLRWTPTVLQALQGRFAVALRVEDDDGGFVNQAFQVEVSWLDRDQDGMSDGWERQYGLDPDDPGDAGDDPDADGLTNLQEFRERRDPTRSGIPDRPGHLSPEDGAWVTTSTPQLVVANAFDPDNDRLTYTFQLAEDADFRRIPVEERGVVEGEDGRTAWRLRLPLQEGRVYWWRVRASDGPFHSEYTDPWLFTVNSFPEPPGLPEQRAPRDGAPVGTPRPELTVGAVFDPDGDPVEIRFEVFRDAAGLDLAIAGGSPQERGAVTVAWAPEAPLDEDTDYWWRAEAVDAAGLSSGYTGMWTFRVNSDNEAPPPPEILRPSDGAHVAARTVLLALRASADPEGDRVVHRIEVDLAPDFGTPARETFADLAPAMGDVVTVELAGRADNTLYHWRARAEDGLAESPWVASTFVVDLENEAPGAPVALSPADGESVLPDAVELVVTPARDPDHDPLQHFFEVALDGEFGEAVAASDGVAAPEGEVAAWTVAGLEAGREYFWRARAMDPRRLRGPWSAVRRFTTDAVPVGEGGGDGGGDGGEGDEGDEGDEGGGGGGDGGGGGGGGVGGEDGGVAGASPDEDLGGGRSRAGGCACRMSGAAGPEGGGGAGAISFFAALGALAAGAARRRRTVR